MCDTEWTRQCQGFAGGLCLKIDDTVAGVVMMTLQKGVVPLSNKTAFVPDFIVGQNFIVTK